VVAECRFFACTSCRFTVEAWSDGNPYYRDEAGRKRYAYHPDHENLARCIGNDEPHLCTACGRKVKVDSLKPRTRCPGCKAEALVAVWDLEGVACPKCRVGTLHVDPERMAIS
jgi:DNA-directed RNA polymerase subunit RPC12/RpoP